MSGGCRSNAQPVIAPPERLDAAVTDGAEPSTLENATYQAVDDAAQTRKFDVRLYTYDGRGLLAAARLYQGQTTNFQTPGGGFAPVFVI